MNSREAIKSLLKAGFSYRQGRGSHLVFTDGTNRIVVPKGNQLSPGMAGKVRSLLNRDAKASE